jgi:sugar phosphate isomerase/epimerase
VRRVSFSTAGLYPRDTLESLALLAEAGYPEAELMPQCLEETTPAFALRASGAGIRVSSIHFPLAYFSVLYNAYDGMRQEAGRMCAALTEAGRVLGSEILVVHPLKEGPFDEPVRDNLRRLADMAGRCGIRVALENNPHSEGATPGGLRAALERLHHPNIGPMVDVTEAAEAGLDPADFLRELPCIHLHLSDHDGEAKHLPVGKGKTDWTAVLRAVRDSGYGGIHVIEPAYRYFQQGARTELVRCREFLETMA